MRKDLMVNRMSTPGVWNVPDIDEMFERAFRNPLSLLDEFQVTPTMDREWFSPQVDVEENDDAYLLSVDLPGVKKDDVRVDLADDVLTISGERKREEEQKDRDGVHRYERMYGKFQRRFTLPSTIDVDKVEANMEDGVLRIALPKSESAKPRAIQVQSGKGGFFAKLIGKKKEEKTDSTDATSKAH